MSKRGRKLILDYELIEKAEQLLKEGHYQKTVCEYLGISGQTWFNWINKGEELSQLSEEELQEIPNAQIYVDFFDAIKRASSYAEIEAANMIKKHGKKSWQAYAWFLERRFRDRWGRVNPDEPGYDEEQKAQESRTIILTNEDEMRRLMNERNNRSKESED